MWEEVSVGVSHCGVGVRDKEDYEWDEGGMSVGGSECGGEPLWGGSEG